MKKWFYVIGIFLISLVVLQLFTIVFAVAWKLATWIILAAVATLLLYASKLKRKCKR